LASNSGLAELSLPDLVALAVVHAELEFAQAFGQEAVDGDAVVRARADALRIG
jgi:hypothetical protein